jgi:hypothetical protein
MNFAAYYFDDIEPHQSKVNDITSTRRLTPPAIGFFRFGDTTLTRFLLRFDGGKFLIEIVELFPPHPAIRYERETDAVHSLKCWKRKPLIAGGEQGCVISSFSLI